MPRRHSSAADVASDAVMHEWQRRARDIVDARLPQILHQRDERSAQPISEYNNTVGPTSADVSRLSLAVGSAAASPVPVRPLQAEVGAGSRAPPSPASPSSAASSPSMLSDDTVGSLQPRSVRAAPLSSRTAQGRRASLQGPPPRRSSLSPGARDGTQGGPLRSTDEWAVTVAVRARPLNAQELAMGDSNVWHFDTEHATAIEKRRDGAQPKLHRFTHVFPPGASTAAVYDDVGVPIVDAALSGHPATIMAYGQTSTGKTHTLMGTPDEPGIVILAVHDLFAAVTAALRKGKRQYELRISYLELFNEELKDLFDPSSKTLRIVDDPHIGTTVHNATEEVVRSPDRVLQLLTIGEANRAVSMTNMNARSSRSHCIFRLTIESWSAENDREDADDVRSSVLNLVDLAGSERVSKTGATGARMKESARINTSLLTLGTVISKLTSGAEHIPYRDSKLTRLLSSSLGGDARTGIICTVSPAGWNKGETRSTMQFAERAMRIVNRPSAPAPPDSTSLLGRYRREIKSLRAALLEAQAEGGDMMLDGERLTPAEVVSRLQAAHRNKETALVEQLTAVQAAEEQGQLAVSSLLELLLAASHGMAALDQAPDIVHLMRDVAVGSSSAPRAVRTVYAAVPGLQVALQQDRGSAEAAGSPKQLVHLTASTRSDTQVFSPDEFARRLAALQSERDALAAECSALRDEQRHQEGRTDEMGDIVVEMQEQLTATRQELSAARTEARRQREAAAAASRQAQAKEQRLAEARAREEALQEQLQDAQATLGDTVAELSASQQAAALRAEQAEEQLEQAREQVKLNQEHSQEQEGRLADLRRELTDARVRVDSLSLQLEDRTTGEARWRNKADAAAQREKELQAEVRQLREQTLQQLEDTSSQAAAEVRAARAAQADTQRRLDASSEALEGTREELREKTSTCDRLAQQLQQQHTRLSAMESDAEHTSQQLSSTNEELQETREQLSSTQAQCTQLQQDKQVAQQESAQLQQRLSDATQQQQQLQSAHDDLVTQVRQLQQQLAASQQQLSASQDDLRAAEERLQQQNKSIEGLESALRTCRQRLQEEHAALVALQAEHAQCGGTAQEQAQQVGAATSRAERAEARQQQLAAELQTAEADLHETREQLQQQKARLEAVSTERAVFYERMSSAEQQVQVSNQLLLGAHEAVASMEQQVAEAEERVTTIRLAVLRAENHATRSAFSELEGELQEAKRNLSSSAGSGRALQSQGRSGQPPPQPVVTTAGGGQASSASAVSSSTTSSGTSAVSFQYMLHSSSDAAATSSTAAGAPSPTAAVPPVTPGKSVLDSSHLTPMSAISRGTAGSTPFSLSSSDTPSPQVKFDSTQ